MDRYRLFGSGRWTEETQQTSRTLRNIGFLPPLAEQSGAGGPPEDKKHGSLLLEILQRKLHHLSMSGDEYLLQLLDDSEFL